MEEKKLSYYLEKSRNIANEKFDKKLRIAILNSFTINGLEESLRVRCADEKIQSISYIGGYNQYMQEILDDKSNLYSFEPEITFLILDVRSIFGDNYFFSYDISAQKRKEFVKNKTNELTDLVRSFMKKSNSKLVITNLLVPTYTSFGILETKYEYGFHEMICDFNSILSSNLRDESGVYVYDFDQFVKKYGERNVFDYRKYFFGDIKISLDHIPILAYDLMGYIKPMTGKNRKCIVLDLDNTLWGGIVGEDGFDGISLGPSYPGNPFVEFQRLLLALWKRGIILAINSRNNPDDALQVLREHPYMILKEEHFASIMINWNDKATNLKEIGKELNIGLNSIVFFDDDPVNRELIKSTLPEVLTVDLPNDPSLYPQTLIELNDFNVLQITEEDFKRGQMYTQQKARTELKNDISNLDDFLKHLEIKVTIKNANDFTIPRISQLTLKTNQFNLTTKRYQEEDIRKFANSSNKIVGCAQVEDKFGDNGITSVFIINKDNSLEWSIDTFLLSCRVMGRKVEDAILSTILQKAKDDGVQKINGNYIPTKKNMPCEKFLAENGFKKENNIWSYSLNNKIKIPQHLDVKNEDE